MQFLRLGFDGYKKIMVNLMEVAAHLAKGILDTGTLPILPDLICDSLSCSKLGIQSSKLEFVERHGLWPVGYCKCSRLTGEHGQCLSQLHSLQSMAASGSTACTEPVKQHSIRELSMHSITTTR